MTCAFTALIGRPSLAATLPWVRIGDCIEDHTSALPGRTSAMAVCGSRAELLRKLNVNDASTVRVSSGTFGTARGISAALSLAKMVASDSLVGLLAYQKSDRGHV